MHAATYAAHRHLLPLLLPPSPDTHGGEERLRLCHLAELSAGLEAAALAC
jgi:hypothetical protein